MLPRLDPEVMAGTPVLCPHRRDDLAFEMRILGADEWRFQCVCKRCFIVWKSPEVPNRILGKCWLNVYEGRQRFDSEEANRRVQSPAFREEMLAMIRDLGVDPEVD